MKTRLNKILAQAGLTSRRGADRLITERRVAVNGAVIDTPGALVDPDVDRVVVDGRPLPAAERHEYVLLNKPRGYVTSLRDPRGRPVVTDLLPAGAPRLYPVGRLDFDVEGALLLTNDGPLTHQLLHPRYGVPRVYEATVAGEVRPAELPRWRAGIVLDDGPARPQRVELTGRVQGGTVVRLTFAEGRKHEVKRFCDGLGHPVMHLRRIAFGPLSVGDLAVGRARRLREPEIAALRRASRLPRSPR